MKGTLRHDQYLTDLSLAYPKGKLIGEIVAPVVPVNFFSNKIFVDSDDAINQVQDFAEGSSSQRVDFEAGTPYSYRTTRKALHDVVLAKEALNSDIAIRLKQQITEKLTHRLLLKHELRVASILTDTTKIANINLASTGHNQLNETGGSEEFEKDIVIAVKSIFDNTGATANMIVIPFHAALHVANLSFVKESLKYQYGMEILTGELQRQAMAVVGLPPVIKGLRVVIASGRVNTNAKGQTKSVSNPWGNNIIIGHVPENPGLDSMFGVLTMEYESRKVIVENVTDPAGEKIIVEWDYDILEADLNNFYLLTNVIA